MGHRRRGVGWGYYYLVTVLDDFSRSILAHKLQRDMTSDSFIEVVQDAVDKTGMTEVPVEDSTRSSSATSVELLLSAAGPPLPIEAARAFRLPLGYTADSFAIFSRYIASTVAWPVFVAVPCGPPAVLCLVCDDPWER